MLKFLKPDNLRSQYQGGRLIATLAKDVGKSYGEWIKKLAHDPATAVRSSAGLAADWMEISRDALLKASGREVEPSKRSADRRFGGEAWGKHAHFDVLRRGYESYARAALKMIDETEGLDAEDRRKVRFYTAQFLDLVAPANYPLLNPEFYESVVESRGRNLVAGLKNLWQDIDFSHGKLNISMSDLGAFEVGESLAITPGEVVYQNDLMQLIQYSPATEKVARRPLLVIPPWFNKYYVLDMQPKNSMIRYMVDQGHTVFLISWRNPDEHMPDKTFDQYMTEGPLAALEVIEAITGEEEVNALGYCLGGILLAITLAWLEARGRRPIRSGTYLTTLLDYSDVGDVKVFVNEDVIKRLEAMGRKKGYLPGDNVAWGFRLLRAPDLLYSFIINHYLLGRPRMPFDLLYWNEDATNMPLSAHMFFMKNMYIGNQLRKPGGITLAGEAIDLTRVETPAYVLSTKDDHIAPWQTTYEATQLFSGPTRFVLGNSGHIAGVINPPTKEKYGYRFGTKNPADAEEWFDRATERPGSWWPDWARWLARYAGGQVPAREPGSEDFPSLEPAPGSYVRQQLHPQPPKKHGPGPGARSGMNGNGRARVNGHAAGTSKKASPASATAKAPVAKTASKPVTARRKAAASSAAAAPKAAGAGKAKPRVAKKTASRGASKARATGAGKASTAKRKATQRTAAKPAVAKATKPKTAKPAAAKAKAARKAPAKKARAAKPKTTKTRPARSTTRRKTGNARTGA
jgi:polyhydroxyalkanoate synthase